MTGDRVTEIVSQWRAANAGDSQAVQRLRANVVPNITALLDALASRDAALARVEAAVARYDDGCPGDDECCAEPLTDAIRAALSGTNQEGEAR